MSDPMSRLAFQMTALWFRLRDWRTPPQGFLSEAGLEPGFHVLDYGCGPGSYALAAAGLVGPAGRVYAADVNSLALQHVQRLAARKGLRNVQAIHTDCATELDAGSVDVALLYDTFHDLADPAGVLVELHRVLKPNGVLSFSDHHMHEAEILAQVTDQDRVRLSRKGQKTYRFLSNGWRPAQAASTLEAS